MHNNIRDLKDSGIEWIGKIPANWEITNYRHVFQRRKEYDDNPNKQVLSLTVTGVKEKNESFGKMAEDFTGHQIVKQGDLVFTPRDFDATPILSGIAPCDGCISNLYFVLYPRDVNTLPRFYDYFMWGVKWGGDIWKKLSYGMRFSYNYNQFCSLPTLALPLHEQRAIADYLDDKCGEIDSAIAKQRDIIDRLREYKNAVITETVCHGLNPNVPMKDSGIEWIGKIPEHWKQRKLKYFIIERIQGNWGTESTGTTGDCICLRIADFDYNSFRFTNSPVLTVRHYEPETIKKLQLHLGDILIEKSGGGEKTPVGRSVVFDKKYPAVYANFMEKLRCRQDVLPFFMEYVLVAFYKNGYIHNYIKQTIGIQNLDLTAMLATEVLPLPDISEQQEIVNYLDKRCAGIDTIIAKRERLVELLTEYKHSLIYECVTGKKEVANV